MTTLITSHPSAPLGKVHFLGQYGKADFPRGSVILCRNTAPLIAFAYSLLHRDVPCRILGRDIGAQLVSLVNKLRGVNLEDLRDKLNTWKDRETTRAIGEGKNPERIEDQHACLVFFINGLDEDSRTIPSLIAKIELMFTDDSATASSRVTLSTIHKSKGLEYPTVFILDRSRYMPSKYALQPWQKEQERNLLYVAITRTQETLVYINSDCWKEEV